LSKHSLILCCILPLKEIIKFKNIAIDNYLKYK